MYNKLLPPPYGYLSLMSLFIVIFLMILLPPSYGIIDYIFLIILYTQIKVLFYYKTINYNRLLKTIKLTLATTQRTKNMIVRHYASMSKISEKQVKFVFNHHNEAHGMMKKEPITAANEGNQRKTQVNELMKEEKKSKK
jgi:hypothetical protein